MTEDFVLRADSGAVAVLTLNRPAVRNCFDRRMALRLQEHLAACAADTRVRAVVLTGAGPGFCAGQDLNEFMACPEPGRIRATVEACYNPTIRAIRDLERPVVCAMNGTAAGAGANLALACDFVIAAESACFIQSFTKIGLVPDSGGSFFLPRLVGMARATELILLGDKLPAAEAARWGLIHRAVPDPDLMEAAMALARRLAGMPTRALGMSKRLINAGVVNPLDAQLDLERDVQAEAGGTADFREGVAAFLEKRPPRFEGR
ncbi:MAG: 2-(1,2-epoxy-1,2-dihydrophenyl)acetyl-CoA isomerase [Candidatus Eisenbacteria bacterium]|nr:2-(1,2-epoxy-1,2-dihydrophenyl)acetyl-CoA isomerase [Candidatus Eisenbacteria bacterium]